MTAFSKLTALSAAMASVLSQAPALKPSEENATLVSNSKKPSRHTGIAAARRAAKKARNVRLHKLHLR